MTQLIAWGSNVTESVAVRQQAALAEIRQGIAMAMDRALNDALALGGQGPYLNLGWYSPAGSEELTNRASEAMRRVIRQTVERAAPVIHAGRAWREVGYLTLEEYGESLPDAQRFQRAAEAIEYGEDTRLPKIYDPAETTLFRHGLTQRLRPSFKGYLQYLAEAAPMVWEHLHQSYDFALPMGQRSGHTYITAGSESGKSELMKALISEHVRHAQTGAIVILDVHGKLAGEVARWPEIHREPGRLVYLDPKLFAGRVLCVNPFDVPPGVDLWEYAEGLAMTLEETLGESRSLVQQETLRHCAYALLVAGGKDLRDLMALLEDDETILREVRKSLAGDYAGHFFESPLLFAAKERRATKQALVMRLNGLLAGPGFGLFCGRSSVQLEPLLTPGRVIVCSVGRSENGLRLGRFLLSSMEAIALKRADGHAFIPVHVFVDECQNFLSRSTIETLLNEARKFGFHLTLAQQTAGSKVTSRDVEDALYNNTKLKFTGGTEYDQTAARLAGRSLEELRALKQGQFYVRTKGNPSLVVTVRDDLADRRNSISESAWQASCAAQAQWYKLPEPLHRPPPPSAQPTPASADVVADEGFVMTPAAPGAKPTKPGKRKPVTSDPAAAEDAATHVIDLI